MAGECIQAAGANAGKPCLAGQQEDDSGLVAVVNYLSTGDPSFVPCGENSRRHKELFRLASPDVER